MTPDSLIEARRAETLGSVHESDGAGTAIAKPFLEHTMTDTLIEELALELLNSDREAGSWPPKKSRDGIPNSDSYVRNAEVAQAFFNRQILALQAERDKAVHPILAGIMQEVSKATDKFPTWPTRIIDAGNVVSEEAGGLAKACLQVVYEPHKETLSGVRMEAIQTAAMCFRFLASMDRYDLSEGAQHEQPTLSTKGEGA